MTANQRMPAAQYLRMSTEHQRYSLENQSVAIRKYAELHGFEVVRTYSDAAKSGLVLKHRDGLRQLLEDAVSGRSSLKAILVYDVSRWGRFQDTDESAHYEFLCKSSGVPVHYCAETFTNDGTLPNLIMKALKRTMAGEYSRELGVRVLAGQTRLARLGFKQGGMPGYGLRRMLVTPDRRYKQLLAKGERKSIAGDRVILVPGPDEEVKVIREIYRLLVFDGLSVYAIASELNKNRVEYVMGSKWDYQAVYRILTQPKYAGCHVYGRTSCKLHTPTRKLPTSQWVVTAGAFESIVDYTSFVQAQQILEGRTINQSDERILESLKAMLGREGRLSLSLIKNSPDLPSPSTYRNRFGSLRRSYELIGYGYPQDFGPIDLRRRTQGARELLINQIASMFPGDVSVVQRGGRWRRRLRLGKALMVSVLIGRFVQISNQTRRWQINAIWHEHRLVTLLARLDEENASFLDFHVLPNVNRRGRFVVSLNDTWLTRGQRLSELPDFCNVVKKVHAAKIVRL